MSLAKIPSSWRNVHQPPPTVLRSAVNPISILESALLDSKRTVVMTPPNSSPSFLDKHFVGPLAVPVVGPERSSAAVPNSPSQISKKAAGRHTGENIRVDKSHAPRDERIPNADQTESTSDQLVKDLIGREGWLRLHATDSVSYTHLTLPTKA